MTFNAALSHLVAREFQGLLTSLLRRWSSPKATQHTSQDAGHARLGAGPGDVRFVALALGIAAAIVYALTAHWGPGGRVNPGDSAKFQYLPLVNGTPHATGYPAYLMIGKLFFWALPFLPVSARVTAISVVCGACGVAVVFLACVECTGAVLASAGAAALVAVGANVWLAATDAEVYALHLLFYASVLLFLIRALNGSGRAPLRSALMLYALSFGNHLTMIALAPAVLWVVATLEGRRLLRPRMLAALAGLGLLAAGQYAYIYYLSHWGGGRELEYVRRDVSLSRLFQYMTGQQFKSRFFVYSLRQIVGERLGGAFGVITQQLSLGGVALASLGLFRVLVRPTRGRFLPVVGLALAGQLFIALNYRVESGLYLTPVALLLSCLVAFGLMSLERPWLVALVAVGLVLFHARDSLTASPLRAVNPIAAQVRWQSAQAIGCRALLAEPTQYGFAQVRRYLRFSGEYPLAIPLGKASEIDATSGLCVDGAWKKRLEASGYLFQPQRDSLEAFFARNAGHTLLVALASDAELGPEARRAFESIGAAASQLGTGGAYVGVFQGGRPIAEQLSRGKRVQLSLRADSHPEGFAPRQLIELRAAGKRFGGQASIRLGDDAVGTARRSARFVVLDSEQNVLGDASIRVAHLERFYLYFALEQAAPNPASDNPR
jgi:hypothetical protein